MDEPLSPIPIKDALHEIAPIDAIQIQGWVRTRRDSKDFSFIELNDGSCLCNLQIIAKTRCQITPRYNDLPRALPLACAVRWSLRKAKGKNGKSSPTRLTSSESPMIPTRYRRRCIRPSFCVRSRISVHARTFLAASFVFVAGLHSPFTNFFTSAVSFTSIRRSSPEAIAKEQGNCFALQQSTPKRYRERRTGKSIIQKTSSRARLI